MGNSIRGGVARQVRIDNREYEPAEGTNLTYNESGRSGAVRVAGNGVTYGESNPYAGFFSQDLAVDAEQLTELTKLQTSGRFVPVTVVTPGDETLDGKMKIANEGALQSANGVVSIEMGGTLRAR